MAGGSSSHAPPLTQGPQVARPLHVQRLEHSLQLDPFLNSAEKQLSYTIKSSDDDSSDQSEAESSSSFCFQKTNGTHSTRQERRHDRMTHYNLFKVKKNRKWIKTLLLSDSSGSSEEEEVIVTSSDIDQMLKIHKLKQISAVEFSSNSKLHQYQYLSAGLLSTHDKFYEHQKLILGTKKQFKDRVSRPKVKAKKIKMEANDELSLSQQEEAVIAEALKLEESSNQGCEDLLPLEMLCASSSSKGRKKSAANQQPQPAVLAARRRRLWIALAKKEINRAQKQMSTSHKEVLSNARKLALACQRECRRSALLSQKVMKDTPSRSRRLTKEMLLYWKRYEKVEREHRRKAEKEAQEQLRMDIERREAKRQQRKLNFLITQTELYAHFMSRKIDNLEEAGEDHILQQLDEVKEEHPLIDDDYDCDAVKARALKNAKDAFDAHMEKHQTFSAESSASPTKTKRKSEVSHDFNDNFRLADPSLSTDEDLPQPNIFFGKLKVYQLKGMNWLNNLYDKGINGILADEMGLGKTVQTIAFLAMLAESQGIWGPFLIIAPASTLHNWQQEFCKFVPRFKVLPYWGNTADRKILRKFWSQKGDLHVETSPFHVLVTSYQLVVQDVKYFQRIKWQYMVLDEAQAIKSTSSVRWKILLGFSCRNRLLLTGTPIQNSMAELWALLHFIMPTLFDSHEEFNEWFSKDIESHAENKSTIDEKHLSRLHMILKPFMLRRIKKDVENELSDKIEILVKCGLTERQKALYRSLRSKISIEDLMQTSLATSQSATSSLMNLVMQFRKVCNHPDLFERREAKAPYRFSLDPWTIPRLLFRDCILYRGDPTREKIILQNLNIFTSDYVHHSTYSHASTRNDRSATWDSPFSFLRLMGLTPGDLSRAVLSGLIARWLICYLVQQEAYRIRSLWTKERRGPLHLLLPPLDLPEPFLFTGTCNTFYSFSDHWHHALAREVLSATPTDSTVRNLQDLAAVTQKARRCRSSQIHKCQPAFIPRFLFQYCPKVLSSQPQYYTADPCHRLMQHRHRLTEGRKLVWEGPEDRNRNQLFFPSPLGGLSAVVPPNSWSHIIIPDRETVVTDSGKLRVLDVLLGRLKSEGHRILIYSQMTRMIDLLEEYMWHRKHTYMRLDGSSKISDRRDMVADFQTRADIFVFLLSTRAGGLGINLTAADTVIFYDSDWNPTVDQQAMDRAHRLGQTKQVTVYRLICNGTIEERILDRACQKSEIQRMVISGGNFKPDTLKPKEVVSLLLDDEELERKFHQRQEERKTTDDYGFKEKKRKKEKLGKPPGKRKRHEESRPVVPPVSLAPPEQQADVSVLSVESMPPSPYNSEHSASSNLLLQEESSNEESPLVVVDDSNPPLSTRETVSPVPFFSLTGTGWSTIDGTLEVSPPSTPTSQLLLGLGASSSGKRGSGRARGRPRGSGRGSRGGTSSGGAAGGTSARGARSNTLATTAAELAAAQAGKSAAFAAYNFALQNLSTSPVSSSGRSGGKGVQARASRGLQHHQQQHHSLSHKLLSQHQSSCTNSDK